MEKHIIDKQELSIVLTDKKDAYLVQDTVKRAYKTYVLPKLDRLFDKYSLPEYYLIIDKLNIDIGTLSIQQLETDFSDIVEKKVEEELVKYRIEFENNIRVFKSYQSTEINENALIQESGLKTKDELWLEALEKFLHSGTLTWWINREPGTSVESIIKHLIQYQPVKTKKLLEKQLKCSLVRKRLIFQVSDRLLLKLVLFLNLESSKDVLTAITNLMILHSKRAVINLSETKFRECVFNSIFIEAIKVDDTVLNTTSGGVIIFYKIICSLVYASGIRNPSAKEITIVLKRIIRTLENTGIRKIINPDILKQTVKTLMEQFREAALLHEKPGSKDFKDHLEKQGIKAGRQNKNKREEIARPEEDVSKNRTNAGDEKKIEISIEKEDNEISINQKVDRKEKENQLEKDTLTDYVHKQEIPAEQERSISSEEEKDLSEKDRETTIEKNNALASEEENDFTPPDRDLSTVESQLSKMNHSFESEFERSFAEPFYEIPAIDEEHITNAGLVIVWPFISRFFSALRLVSKDKFVSDEASYKAIHILQYLATGQIKTPEHELLLNKLLCGVDIHEPVPAGCKLTRKEKRECKLLLSDIIENWNALLNTSIESLRTTFLQKEGILKKQSGGWKLIIERTTVDILIDRLPWSISVIKLPWSKEIIFVEW